MKVLYLMHVNWYWIRQRPHVLAEELARNHELSLLHFAMYHRDHRAAEAPPPFSEQVLWRLPERILRFGSFFDHVNVLLLKKQLLIHLKAFKPDIIWVTHPVFEPVLRELNDCPVIYDCMDDHLAFNADSSDNLAQWEKQLVQLAELTIFSSQTLAERVSQRSLVRRAEVVNNGVAESLIRRSLAHKMTDYVDDGIVFGYFGTISHWFDWTLVFEILENLPNARLRLAGPVETYIPEHSRIEHVGILPHSELTQFIEQCNAFIMPFIVNRLIEAVDPVKLYEYIAYGLPILAPWYHETERFLPWVNLYHNVDEAVAISKTLLSPLKDKDPLEQRHAFLNDNSWEIRCLKINEAMAKLII